ncbi:MAG: Epoxyqueuosine reductase [candidate division TA06 bacterium ADurb.Bin131]|uniref:Epoxyqueuosine reductase n=1 Tax=candidate division TA06 bacterium ADurb.Bin131 TaxID=1852827 RepID=A0A1V6C532_UNCT6|nr:MAG: Epoxyqueuosine reductase [candidate division TA06 bacterium ADurb.Bin131]HON04786.1 hypothetical protein [bacterium]HRV03464.1 hypothetical protein [Candidatus Ratteibacteria bacterium]
MKNLTEQVKDYAKTLGADFVGIAPVERFKNAPLRMSPQGLLPSAESVIVCGIHHLDASIELSGEPTPHNMGSYSTQSSVMNPTLDDISFNIAIFLEKKGYRTLPIVSSNIWRYKGYKDLKVHFAPDIAHRYAAVAAGLGEIGWSGLFLHPEFGPRVRLVTIITDAGLVPDKMYGGKKLCDKCMECVKNCPVDAFRKEVKKINEIEIAGKKYKFPETNKWRCGWAENFGLNLFLEIPKKIDEDVILKNLEKYGYSAGEIGSCLRFCMIPEKRYYDKTYSRAPRRKKSKKKISMEELKKITDKYLIDYLCIKNNNNNNIDNEQLHPEYYLPDVTSIICIGVKKLGLASKETENHLISRIMGYAAFDIAHYLDINGYSAITHPQIDSNLIAHTLKTWHKNTTYSTVLTGADIQEIQVIRKPNKKEIEKEKFRDFCKGTGVDLVGFFDCSRFKEFKTKFLKKFPLQQQKETVYDAANNIYMPYSPEIKDEEIKLKSPEDYLGNAKSIIVIGLHFPDASIDTAKITPAETVGPYAFAQFETLNLLNDAAYKIIKRLNDSGYKADYCYDLTGLSSFVLSSRGILPDMRANAFAAMLAGLAHIGKNGCPITPGFGQRQRFLSIITDFHFSNDPLLEDKSPCEKCTECIEGCPTNAIKTCKEIRLEGIEFKIPLIDDFSCDWAKRYGLIGKEGPEYMGLDVNHNIPAEKTLNKLCENLIKTRWGVQKRHLNICEECIRICPYKGQRGKNDNI